MAGISQRQIKLEDGRMLERQARFRVAADAVTQALARFDEVDAVALFGSVARPLWPEVPRFSPFRQQRVEIWHECKDVDLAVWLTRLDRLRELNRARNTSVQRILAMTGVGVANHEVDIFILEPGTNRYLGRLCKFAQCPKGKPACEAPGCGRDAFLRQHEDFVFWSNALDEDRIMRLYNRREGIIRRAADTPASGRELQEDRGAFQSPPAEASLRA